MILTVQERMNFQYLLPMQGSLKTLELVEGIIQKIHVSESNEAEKEVKLEKEELDLMKNSIVVLDQNDKLPFQALSLIRKIMEEQI